MIGHKSKFENYQRALSRLTEGIAKYDESNDLARDGIIQRFEFTFELAWKTLKSLFEDEGLTGLNSPKTVLREAFSAGIVEDDELWLSMLRDRNTTAHIYDEHLSIEICNNIRDKYVSAFTELVLRISLRIGGEEKL
ncbi:nucleotidyltransferase [Heliobacillus mobilis]|uniref:Nucleotidyltransferase n=1 Tax=Heliobacterium mobile TaxID=28064 RepID=A0A6I3SBV6_HELMO|nr:nucleotidyltransferase substrate binding protein [Heliobacterium mobile]MTV47389.1 nucleotidyltransferase [Heliobacterium mobile]